MAIGPVAHSPDFVVGAIRSAAARTGADFDYLVRTATRESGLRSHVNSTTSSAAGPFQFIEQTWLSMLQRHGPQHGYSGYAEAIERGANGRYQIADEGMREEILALRHDPRAAALMAGEMTNEATQALEGALGRRLRENEAYVAHFMGLGGATRLIREVEENPETMAADLFPRAAEANRRIFYNEDGTAKSVADVYANLTSLPEVDAAQMAASTPPAGEAPALRGSLDGPRISNSSFSTANFTGSAPGSFSMLLTPGVMEILASLDPLVLTGDREERDAGRMAGV